jgi:hypothetical protein
MPPIKRPAYPYITAYGRYLGSKQYYIADTKERATEDNAPNDVVFYRVEDGNRVWTTIDQLPGDLKANLYYRMTSSPQTLGKQAGSTMTDKSERIIPLCFSHMDSACRNHPKVVCCCVLADNWHLPRFCM